MKSMQGMALFYFLSQLASFVVERGFFGGDDIDLANQLTGYNAAQIAGPGILTIPKIGVGFLLNGVPRLVAFNFSFFEGEWRIIQLGLIMVTTGPFLYEHVLKPFIFALQGLWQRFF